MTGTLERADRRPILWLGYRRDRLATRLARVDPQAPGWALVGYDRRAALAERAIIPIRFGALDGEAEWRLGRERCAAASFADARRPATADAVHGAAHRVRRGGLATSPGRLPPAPRARSASGCGSRPGRPRAASASSWWWHRTRPPRGATRPCLQGVLGSTQAVALAISDERDAVERIARFRLRPATRGAGHGRHGLRGHGRARDQPCRLPDPDPLRAVARADGGPRHPVRPARRRLRAATGGDLPSRRPAVPPLSPRHRGRPVRACPRPPPARSRRSCRWRTRRT